ncbi:MAG: alpha/beta hydrolase [Verrucomicrobiia bacterium Tous-C2TDCM]|nr:MAG: alpha/beta hydrolase [Verrucomicrobiae bacterium Tous-C2TDCM]
MNPFLATLALVLFGLPFLSRAAEGETKPRRMPLWPEGKAPNGDGSNDTANAFYTLHRPAQPNGAALVICPGGGYGGLVTGGEGHGIAAWLNGHGITGIVLEYRLPKGRCEVPLRDAQRALRTARFHAKEWGIDPKRLGIIGFSAGGHLASTAGTHFDEGDANSGDPIERLGCRPDFMVLVYPVITMAANAHAGSRRNLLGPEPNAALVTRFSNERQVTEKTPPGFLTHAEDDKVVVSANSEDFHAALVNHGVPARYLALPSGGHGLNGYKGPMWEAWQQQSLAWLAEIEMIPAR